MFARFLEMTIKPDKKPELMKRIKDQIIPIFKTYNGFFDVIHLEVETDPTRFYAISLWHDKVDMEKYAKEEFPKVNMILEPFLTTPLIMKRCVIDETITSQKFIAAVAA